MKFRLLFVFFFAGTHFSMQAQSVDSRICNCFTTAVADNLLDGTKVVYGSIGIIPRRGEDVTPNQSQPVKFVLPKITPKQGCGVVYKIYIADETGAKVYEDEDSQNEFSYTFPQCDKRYEVRLIATAKSPGGRDGNCTRRTTIYVKPKCNTNTCDCDPPATGKNTGTSRNIGIEGKLVCQDPTATTKRYLFQHTLVNKTACRMVVEQITVLGQSAGSSAVTIAPNGRSAAFSMVLSTPLTAASPSGGSVNVSVRYKLNDKTCTAVIKMPVEGCR